MILCFTGCGNSRAVADRLAAAVDDSVTLLRGPLLIDAEPPAGAAEHHRIIWVMPVYSWGIPPVIDAYIRRLPEQAFGGTSVHYLVLTCGDDTGYADRLWRRAIESRGYVTAGAWSVQMPNTYTLLPGFDVDPAELAQSKIAAMPERVAAIAQAIMHNEPRPEADVVRGSIPWLKTAVVYPLFRHCDIHPGKFHVTDACTACGLCAKVCPLANIAMTGPEGRPEWGRRCTLCLGCYNNCPHTAIAYGSRTRSKGRYTYPRSR